MRYTAVILFLSIVFTLCGCNSQGVSSDRSFLPSEGEPVASPLLAQSDISIVRYPEFMAAVSGQRCVALVSINESASGYSFKGNYSISATSQPQCELTVQPRQISSSEVAEVTAVPSSTHVGREISITITAAGDGVQKSSLFTITVVNGSAENGDYAAGIRDKFVKWLAVNKPELGITEQAQWTGTIVNPDVTIVSYYLFFSDKWEMGVTWHVMIPPYDWAKIYLRPRYSGMKPVHAFEITSLQSQQEVKVIDPPSEVYR